jgi:hypothetical protein
MKAKFVSWIFIVLLIPLYMEAQEDRVDWDVPKVITPGKPDKAGIVTPPSDAIVLFDGKDLSQFENKRGGGPIRWIIKDGVATIPPKGGDIQTKRNFRDFQLHIEWSAPENENKEGEFKGNSGIYLQGRYEVQVLNSYENKSNPACQAASIYKQKPPLVNVMSKPGEWNIFDIIYTAPTFKEDGTFRTYPVVTVFHNGVVVQNNVTVLGITAADYQGYASGSTHGDGPILLQDHQSEVSFRNIWIRKL